MMAAGPEERRLVDSDWLAPENCTPLYFLEPEGQGGPFVEALSSFVIRIAREHAISPRNMLSQVVGKHIPEIRKVCYGSFFRRHSATIDGMGEYCTQFFQALGKLTSVENLHWLTLYSLRELAGERGSPITCGGPRWCVACLRDMVMAGGEPYRPLIWSMACVSICPIHKEPLTKTCPHCESAQPVIPRWPDIVYCDYCRKSLLTLPSASHALSTIKGIDPCAIWTAFAAADLVRLFPNIKAEALRGAFLSFVASVVSNSTDGNYAEFCKAIGLPSRALNKWLNKENKPALDSIFRLLYALDVWPSDVLLKCKDVASIAPKRMAWRRYKERSLVSAEAVSDRLQTAVSRGTMLPSLSGIARQIGMTRSGLKYRFPAECQEFVVRRRAEQRRRTSERLQLQMEAVGQIVDDLWESGRVPGRKRVELEARKQGFSLLTDEIRRAYYISLASKMGVERDIDCVWPSGDGIFRD